MSGKVKKCSKKKKSIPTNTDDNLKLLLQDEAFVYCKFENYRKAIQQYTWVSIEKITMNLKNIHFNTINHFNILYFM